MGVLDVKWMSCCDSWGGGGTTKDSGPNKGPSGFVGKYCSSPFGVYPMGGKQESRIVAPDVTSSTVFLRLRILFKDKFHLWYCLDDLCQYMTKEQLVIM